MSENWYSLSADAVLTQNPSYVLREEEDDAALLFDPDTGAIRVLNGTALAVWQRLDGQRNLRQVVADLREGYDEFDDAAEQQVAELLKMFLEIEAIGIVEESC